MPSTLIIPRKTAEKLITVRQAVRAVENAFAAQGRGETIMPAKVYLDLPSCGGDFRAMPVYLPSAKVAGVKWVNVHPANARRKLPAVMAVMVINDPRTGFPLAVLDGTFLTNLRTGAAGAVAAKYLARKNARTVALIGCGAQAQTQLAALRTVCRLKTVRVWGLKAAQARQFVRSVRSQTSAPEEFQACVGVEEAVKGADIIVTTTPSRRPLVKAAWVSPGTHINAIGADAPGKQELDPQILKQARVVIDDWAQARHSGEINVALQKKIISPRTIAAELGKVVNGTVPGRTSDNDITVFDSTGLAVQDAAVAAVIYRAARRQKKGRKLALIG